MPYQQHKTVDKKGKNDIHYFSVSYQLNKTPRKKKKYSHLEDLPAIVYVRRQAFINEANKSDPQQEMGVTRGSLPSFRGDGLQMRS